MTPQEFKDWRKGIGLTQQEAADALGISKGSIILYEAGKRRGDDRPVTIPKVVELACCEVSRRLSAPEPAID
jgi:transcriptional regulator with XRE-family HTH domain